MTDLDELQKQLIETISPSIAVAVQTALSRDRTQKLLTQTRAQAADLKRSSTLIEKKNQELQEAWSSWRPGPKNWWPPASTSRTSWPT